VKGKKKNLLKVAKIHSRNQISIHEIHAGFAVSPQAAIFKNTVHFDMKES
jgi:hypothetical protein